MPSPFKEKTSVVMTAVDNVFIDTNILVYAHLALSPFHSVAITRLQNCIPKLLTHNTGDFVRFGTFITIMPLDP
jgi:hypothetical protein